MCISKLNEDWLRNCGENQHFIEIDAISNAFIIDYFLQFIISLTPFFWIYIYNDKVLRAI